MKSLHRGLHEIQLATRAGPLGKPRSRSPMVGRSVGCVSARDGALRCWRESTSLSMHEKEMVAFWSRHVGRPLHPSRWLRKRAMCQGNKSVAGRECAVVPLGPRGGKSSWTLRAVDGASPVPNSAFFLGFRSAHDYSIEFRRTFSFHLLQSTINSHL